MGQSRSNASALSECAPRLPVENRQRIAYLRSSLRYGLLSYAFHPENSHVLPLVGSPVETPTRIFQARFTPVSPKDILATTLSHLGIDRHVNVPNQLKQPVVAIGNGQVRVDLMR